MLLLRRLALSLVPLLTVLRLLWAQTTNEELRWAHADSVTSVGETRIGLRAHPWRDFMPPQDGAGSELMVNLQIQALEDRPLPQGLRVDSAWVRSAEGRWSASPSHEPRPELRNGQDLMLRGGPRWATGQGVDVLVRLRLPNGDLRYLVVRDRPIGRTD